MVFPGRAITSRRAPGFALSASSASRAAIPRVAPRSVARVVASQAGRRTNQSAESTSEWRQEFEASREARRADYRARWNTALQVKHKEAIEKRKSLQLAARRAAGRPEPEAKPALAPPPRRSPTPSASSATPVPAEPSERHLVRADEASASASGTSCTVTFNIKFHAEFGQSLKLIGSCPALGSWNISQAPAMLWGQDDVWSISIDVAQSSILEYKYVLLDSYGTPMAWQQGNNGVLAVKSKQSELAVHDNWEGGPGSCVLSKDGSVTRENQLLSWANDIEAMMASTKNQLRQSSMELAAAKEEIRAARMENAHLRTELQVERAMAKRREAEIQELKEANMQLSLQLNESNAGFKKALETASVLLSEIDEMSTGLITMPPDVTAKVQDDATSTPSEDSPASEQVGNHGGSRGYVVASSAVSGIHWIPLDSGSEEEESVRQQ